MSFNFDNNTPIFLQIVEDIKIKIISGEYKVNEKLPSVRDFSVKYGANPNTVQKSLSELESLGLIYTERTNGKFVTNNNTLINKIKQQTIKTKLNRFYKSMEEIGITRTEILHYLDERED